jgi:pimeloyl-ACP methyl ester carboxylesterase
MDHDREMSERFITAAGVRARIVEEGAGEPVLLVHGLAGWIENWAFTMPALAAAGFRAIACDLPGFGQTERSPRARYFDADDPYYVRFLAEVCDTLRIEPAHLVGHSLGGAIASCAAVCTPGRFRSLTLVAPAGYGRRVSLTFRLSSLPVAGIVARLAPTAFVRDTVAACFSDPASAPPWVYEHAARYARAGGALEFTRVMGQTVTLQGPREEIRLAWDDRVRRIALPTLVIWGRQDRVLPVTDLEDVRERLPGARVVLIEGAGHLVQLERPREFNEALISFLRAA